MSLEEVLKSCMPRLFRFALRLTGNQHLAEDLTQEAFLRAWRQRTDLQNERAARVWLFRIAVNVWRDQIRRGRRLRLRSEPLDTVCEELLPGPEQVASGREELARALKAFKALPPRQRDVLYLATVEALSLSEVSQILGVTRNAAKVNLCLARKAMRSLFEKFVEETP